MFPWTFSAEVYLESALKAKVTTMVFWTVDPVTIFDVMESQLQTKKQNWTAGELPNLGGIRYSNPAAPAGHNDVTTGAHKTLVCVPGIAFNLSFQQKKNREFIRRQDQPQPDRHMAWRSILCHREWLYWNNLPFKTRFSHPQQLNNLFYRTAI